MDSSTVSEKLDSSLLGAGSTSIVLESWTDILMCCFFGVTFSDLIKKVLSDSFLAEHGQGQEGEELLKRPSLGLKEVWQDHVLEGLLLLLWNTWRTYDVVGTHRCLYSADLKYKYLSTFLNCPMSFYNMLVAIFNIFPAFKVIKEEIKTFQT